jgi:uncharacterized protein with HEPN domain
VKKDPKNFLEDILFSIERVEKLLRKVDEDRFREDIDSQDIILRRLSVIGEATNNLPKELLEKHQSIKWREWIGMRNVLIHEYFDLKLDTIWKTVVDELPALKKEIEKMLKEK